MPKCKLKQQNANLNGKTQVETAKRKSKQLGWHFAILPRILPFWLTFCRSVAFCHFNLCFAIMIQVMPFWFAFCHLTHILSFLLEFCRFDLQLAILTHILFVLPLRLAFCHFDSHFAVLTHILLLWPALCCLNLSLAILTRILPFSLPFYGFDYFFPS